MRRTPAANPATPKVERTNRKSIPNRKGTRSPSNFPSVSLIGAGNWGTALAWALRDAGIPLREVVVRGKSRSKSSFARALGTRLTGLSRAMLDADVLWICTPDAAISSVAAKLAARLTSMGAVSQKRGPAVNARRVQPVVFHSSGALDSSELAVLRTAGASIASVHPLMTFPRASRSRGKSSPGQLRGIPFSVEGDARACRVAHKLVRALGAEAFLLPGENKALYHAFSAFTSPLLVALLTAATEIAAAAGYSSVQARRWMRPIVEHTLANFFADGPHKSFSGPIARGDATTVARHLDALSAHPGIEAIYRGLSAYALQSLPSRNRSQMERALDNPPTPVPQTSRVLRG